MATSSIHVADRSAVVAELYVEHGANLRHRLMRRGVTRAEAEELVQETFLRLHSHRDRVDLDRSVWGWLVTVSERLRIDRHRRGVDGEEPTESNVIDLRTHEAFGGNGFGHPERSVLMAEQRRAFVRALNSLPDAQAQALAARFLEGRSFEEIAADQQISIVAARSLVARARRGFIAAFGSLDGAFGGVAGIGVLLRRQWRELRARAAAGSGRLASLTHAGSFVSHPAFAVLVVVAVGVVPGFGGADVRGAENVAGDAGVSVTVDPFATLDEEPPEVHDVRPQRGPGASTRNMELPGVEWRPANVEAGVYEHDTPEGDETRNVYAAVDAWFGDEDQRLQPTEGGVYVACVGPVGEASCDAIDTVVAAAPDEQ